METHKAATGATSQGLTEPPQKEAKRHGRRPTHAPASAPTPPAAVRSNIQNERRLTPLWLPPSCPPPPPGHAEKAQRRRYTLRNLWSMAAPLKRAVQLSSRRGSLRGPRCSANPTRSLFDGSRKLMCLGARHALEGFRYVDVLVEKRMLSGPCWDVSVMCSCSWLCRFLE